MHFQFLVEDDSTNKLIDAVMIKLLRKYSEKKITFDCKAFKGIGGFVKKGKPLEQKTGKLLNDLPMYLRAFNRELSYWDKAALVIVLDNDKRDTTQFRKQLENMAIQNKIQIDHVFCIAIKEMEAWLLGDLNAIEAAYPQVRKTYIRSYTQDGICDTWEVLANMIYPGGLTALKKRSGGAYMEIGKAKSEWATKIGIYLDLANNQSPSFQYFINSLKIRIEAA